MVLNATCPGLIVKYYGVAPENPWLLLFIYRSPVKSTSEHKTYLTTNIAFIRNVRQI